MRRIDRRLLVGRLGLVLAVVVVCAAVAVALAKSSTSQFAAEGSVDTVSTDLPSPSSNRHQQTSESSTAEKRSSTPSSTDTLDTSSTATKHQELSATVPHSLDVTDKQSKQPAVAPTTKSSSLLQPVAERKTTIVGVPTHIAASPINLNAAVVPVGLKDNGAQDVPDNPALAGWYKLGPKPGQSGNAVIVGHSYLRGGAVFNRLGQLSEGDEVSLRLGGEQVEYEVVVERVIKKTRYEDIKYQLYDFSGQPQVKLVTCSGEWDYSRNTHLDWTIVTLEQS